MFGEIRPGQIKYGKERKKKKEKKMKEKMINQMCEKCRKRGQEEKYFRKTS